MLLLLSCSSMPATGITAALHTDVATIPVVSWTQEEDVDEARVEYQLDGAWESSPGEAVGAGLVRVPLLGLPADTEVAYRLVERMGERVFTSAEGTVTTGRLPAELPLPTLVAHEPADASAPRWLLTTIAMGDANYSGPWWVYVLDREARVVWYHVILEDRIAVMSRPSADGTHITWSEASWFGDPSTFERTTFDQGYTSSTELPGIGYTYDELPDGSIAYDGWTVGGDIGIRAVSPDGNVSDVWSCTAWLPEGRAWADCGANAVNWDEGRGTYLWSMYDLDTVVEVDPIEGTLDSWGTDGDEPITPTDAGFQLQHYPNWTDAGTLLVHTQQVGEERVQWAREYAWDEASGALEQVWSYAASDLYADCSGEAVRLEEGNTLLNYGCSGEIREITSAGNVVWEVHTGHTVGHQTLLEDLYALNRGPG